MTSMLPAEHERGDAPVTIADRVFDAIQDAIVRGDVAPGTKLTEPELASRYGVSRGPLREALQRLEGRRLVERIPHVGARVAALSFERLIDIYRAREALEGMACRLAAEHASGAEIDALGELLEAHGALEDVQEGSGYFQKEGDLDFHFRIAVASRNAILEQLLCEELYHLMRLYRYKFSGYRGRPHRALSEHRAIVEAIAERDGDFAELLMRRHIAGARRTIEHALREARARGAAHADVANADVANADVAGAGDAETDGPKRTPQEDA